MTFEERQQAKRQVDAAIRAKLDDGRRRRGDKSRCSRCGKPIAECGGLSPGRSWGRKCETRRKLDQYHAKRVA